MFSISKRKNALTRKRMTKKKRKRKSKKEKGNHRMKKKKKEIISVEILPNHSRRDLHDQRRLALSALRAAGVGQGVHLDLVGFSKILPT